MNLLRQVAQLGLTAVAGVVGTFGVLNLTKAIEVWGWDSFMLIHAPKLLPILTSPLTGAVALAAATFALGWLLRGRWDGLWRSTQDEQREMAITLGRQLSNLGARYGDAFRPNPTTFKSEFDPIGYDLLKLGLAPVSSKGSTDADFFAAGFEYIQHVAPFLRRGNIDGAKRAATNLQNRLNAG